MPTNDKKVNIYPKRLLSLTAIKNQFLDYLQGAIDEVGSAFFAGSTGVLSQDKIGLNNSSGGSTFDIVTTPTCHSVLASNHTIDLNSIIGIGITYEIPFANVSTTVYYVGVYYAEVESGIEINPRTGDPEYSALLQTFGNVGTPTSIVDTPGAFLRININSITESGASHAGRKVRVWLVDPVSPIETTAFFEGYSVFIGSDNYIDIPYSGVNGPLGQNTGSQPPSTTVADYRVFIQGVSWRKNTGLRTDNTCTFLGTITGGTTPTFNIDDQTLLQIISLDRAYDGIPGPGAGRSIFVDSGALELNTTSGGADDLHNAQLRLNRVGNTDYFQLGLEIICGDSSALPIAILQTLRDSTHSYILDPETVNISGNTITFPRAAVNLTHMSIHLNKETNLVWLRTGVAAGVYAIVTIPDINHITCKNLLTGASPAWAAASGVQCSILHPRMVFGNRVLLPAATGGTLINWHGLMVTGRDGQNNSTPCLTVLPDGGTGNLVSIKNNRFNATTGAADPRDAILTDIDATAAGSPGMKVQLGQWIGTVGPETDVHTKCGLDIRTQVQGTNAADKYALNIKPQAISGLDIGLPCTRQVGLHHCEGAEIMRWTPWGRLADSHRFVDTFAYKSGTDEVTLVTGNKWFAYQDGDGGFLAFNDPVLNMLSNGDTMLMSTHGMSTYDEIAIRSPAMWVLRSNIYRKINFYARARPIAYGVVPVTNDVRYYLGLRSADGYYRIYFQYYNIAGVNVYWKLNSNTLGTYAEADAAIFDAPGQISNDLGWLDFWFTVNLETNTINYWMTGMESIMGLDIRSGGLNPADWNDMRVQAAIGCVNHTALIQRRFEIDHIEVWDELILAGSKE